tara:strand:+ start:985 stop:1611 length:627 start_codon:yes stop_codon:yes gene_type:complete
MDYRKVRMLIEDYNRNPSKYNDKEAEVIAMLASRTGNRFERESNPLGNLLFSLGNTATFGLLPNSLKPSSRGSSVYGQTAIDALASGFGSIAGLGLGGIGLYKGVTNAGKAIDAIRRMRQKMSMAGQNIGAVSGLPFPQTFRQYSSGGGFKDRMKDIGRKAKDFYKDNEDVLQIGGAGAIIASMLQSGDRETQEMLEEMQRQQMMRGY